MQELYPIKFEEIYKQYIWGGAGLEKFGKNPPHNFAAESWEVACHKDGMSIVANGVLKGKTLEEIIFEFDKDLRGTNLGTEPYTFPLLVKIINAKRKLSVQVHPDDAYAIAHEGEKGKNEAWIVLSAEKNAELIIGLNEGVTKEDFVKAVDNDDVESCLNKMKVSPGDVINVPSGLIHAIGEGIVLAEIQQNSNTTYRVYDYNRKDSEGKTRPLHIEKALDTIDFADKHHNTAAKGLEIASDDVFRRKIYVANRYFCIETFDVKKIVRQETDETTFFICMFTEGEGIIRSGKEDILVKKGDTYLFPASLGKFIIEGDVGFIKSYVPDIKSDVIQPLTEAGYTIERITHDIEGID